MVKISQKQKYRNNVEFYFHRKLNKIIINKIFTVIYKFIINNFIIHSYIQFLIFAYLYLFELEII